MNENGHKENNDVATILVAADEEALVVSLRNLLEGQGFDVLAVSDGMAVVPLVRNFAVDLVILDVMLARMDGFKVCRALRAEGDTPIVMLTMPDDSDKIVCLELQVEAASQRPFGVRELPGRVGQILRRRQRHVVAPPVDSRTIIPRAAPVVIGDLTVMLQERRVYRRGAPIPLTEYEFKMLAYFLHNRGRDCTYPEIIAGIWPAGEDVTPHLIAYFVFQLRKKLAMSPYQPPYLRTVNRAGVRGYRFETTPPELAPRASAILMKQ